MQASYLVDGIIRWEEMIETDGSGFMLIDIQHIQSGSRSKEDSEWLDLMHCKSQNFRLLIDFLILPHIQQPAHSYLFSLAIAATPASWADCSLERS